MKRDDAVELKILKDYALVKEELYRKMPGGILSRCMGQEEAQRKLKEIHDCKGGKYTQNRKRQLRGKGLCRTVWLASTPRPEKGG